MKKRVTLERVKAKTQENQLLLYRRRMKFSQKRVALLLDHPDPSMLSRYETGRSLPPLATVLRLEIIYRVPVAFLYPKLYDELRSKIRKMEGELAGRGQQKLF